MDHMVARLDESFHNLHQAVPPVPQRSREEMTAGFSLGDFLSDKSVMRHIVPPDSRTKDVHSNLRKSACAYSLVEGEVV